MNKATLGRTYSPNPQRNKDFYNSPKVEKTTKNTTNRAISPDPKPQIPPKESERFKQNFNNTMPIDSKFKF